MLTLSIYIPCKEAHFDKIPLKPPKIPAEIPKITAINVLNAGSSISGVEAVLLENAMTIEHPTSPANPIY